MSEAPIATTETPPKTKSPLKKRHEVIEYFFGQPLESFDKLLEVYPSTSANQSTIKPTDQNIIQHWMYLEGIKTTQTSINIVTDDLIEFYSKYHPSVELR